MNCEKCLTLGATVHLMDVLRRRERHLCQECARQEGLLARASNVRALEIKCPECGRACEGPPREVPGGETWTCPACGSILKHSLVLRAGEVVTWRQRER